MNLYKVSGPVLRIGSGDLISLDADQLKRRAHRVQTIEKAGDRVIVRPNEVLDFKNGEVLGIAGDLPKSLIDQVEAVGEAADGKVKVESADVRLNKIIAAIPKLDPKNRRHFTGDGTPAVAALEQLLGFDITQAERDQAWKRAQDEVEKTTSAKRTR